MSTVLVVDDAAICRLPVVAALARAGFTAVGAASGKDALAFTAESCPDLVLLDLNMPEMDGWAVLRALRQDVRYADLQVILTTATLDADGVAKAKELGVHAFLAKSDYSMREIVGHVQRHFAKVNAAA